MTGGQGGGGGQEETEGRGKEGNGEWREWRKK